MEKRKLLVIAVLLLISVMNYYRIKGIENIRAIEFLSIFVIGFLFSRLVFLVIAHFKNN